MSTELFDLTLSIIEIIMKYNDMPGSYWDREILDEIHVVYLQMMEDILNHTYVNEKQLLIEIKNGMKFSSQFFDSFYNFEEKSNRYIVDTPFDESNPYSGIIDSYKKIFRLVISEPDTSFDESKGPIVTCKSITGETIILVE